METIITGFCPEVQRGGAFDLEKVLSTAPRLIRSEEEGYIEIGKVTSFKQGLVFRRNYALKTSEDDVVLKFGRKEEDKTILHLPDSYYFGKEIFY